MFFILVMVHEVNDKLQTQIDTDFLTTATHTNTLVKEIREEKIEEIEGKIKKSTVKKVKRTT
jgi:phosphopantetheine adenylyltransferase